MMVSCRSTSDLTQFAHPLTHGQGLDHHININPAQPYTVNSVKSVACAQFQEKLT